MKDEICDTFIVQSFINSLATACADQLESIVLILGDCMPYYELRYPLRSLRRFTCLKNVGLDAAFFYGWRQEHCEDGNYSWPTDSVEVSLEDHESASDELPGDEGDVADYEHCIEEGDDDPQTCPSLGDLLGGSLETVEEVTILAQAYEADLLCFSDYFATSTKTPCPAFSKSL
jgi:hypothetical protein